MITTTDAANLVYAFAKVLGLPVYQWGNLPREECDEPRVTVRAKQLTPETYFNKCYIDVNIVIPDIDGEADTRLLNFYERLALKEMESKLDIYDDTLYRIKWASSETIEDKQFRSHYVNVRLLFEILNVK